MSGEPASRPRRHASGRWPGKPPGSERSKRPRPGRDRKQPIERLRKLGEEPFSQSRTGSSEDTGHRTIRSRQTRKLRPSLRSKKELGKLPLSDLPKSELITLAEGIRDRIYRPVIRAQDQAREDEERKQKQEQQRADLIGSGLSYAHEELRREEELDGPTRWRIEQKVREVLEREIDGGESETELRPLVNEILDQEIEDADEKRRQEARPRLITHGASYAARELARETDLEPRERWQIEAAVKAELEQELTGAESEGEVEDLVDTFLDEELGEPETDDEDD